MSTEPLKPWTYTCTKCGKGGPEETCPACGYMRFGPFTNWKARCEQVEAERDQARAEEQKEIQARHLAYEFLGTANRERDQAVADARRAAVLLLQTDHPDNHEEANEILARHGLSASKEAGEGG